MLIAEIVGGVMKGNGLLENFDNIVIISADRNGSTAFQYNIFSPSLNNNDENYIWIGEGFHSNSENIKSKKCTPKEVIYSINQGTHKSVVLKSQITYPDFNRGFFDIEASRKIFLHRNLFDSTLSRCIAQTINRWHNLNDEDYAELEIPIKMFKDRLEYRIEKYSLYIDDILKWSEEFYKYEELKFKENLFIKTNPDKKQKVKNYFELYDLFLKYDEVNTIEDKINSYV
jgi:hypothetical protein